MDVDEESEQNLDLAKLNTPACAFIRGFCAYAVCTELECIGPST